MNRNLPSFVQIDRSPAFLFEKAMDIYWMSFPSNERQPLEKIYERVDRGQSQLYVALREQEVLGMALIWDFKDSSYALLDYLAIAEGYRGQQIGSAFFQFLVTHLHKELKYMMIEVEDPSFGLNKEERIQRIDFYLKNGAVLLENVPYVLPSLDQTETTAMRLMMAPAMVSNMMNGSEVKEIIRRLYTEVYEKSEQDLVLQQILDQIPPTISFTQQLSS